MVPRVIIDAAVTTTLLSLRVPNAPRSIINSNPRQLPEARKIVPSSRATRFPRQPRRRQLPTTSPSSAPEVKNIIDRDLGRKSAEVESEEEEAERGAKTLEARGTPTTWRNRIIKSE